MNSHDHANELLAARLAGYQAGYDKGVALEREACAGVCEARYMGDNNREDIEAKRCAAAIRARSQREHVTDDSPCWCNPETTYTDPDTEVSVIVHKEPQ